jgi:alcohol dehydrogenase
LSKGLWDLAVDVAGGDLLTSILASMKYSGVVTCCGLVGGTAFETSIFPFILRGISLIGIDSVEISLDKKVEIWNRFSTDWKLDNLEGICREVDLVEMLAEIDSILEGGQIGRVILKP